MPDEQWYDLIDWYKIVWLHADVMSPYLASQTAYGKAGVVYPPGQWVCAPDWLWQPGYGLCVFQNRKDALDAFKLTGVACQLWKCKIENVREEALPGKLAVWEIADGTINQAAEYPWCNGTVMVQRVMLTDRISTYGDMFGNPFEEE